MAHHEITVGKPESRLVVGKGVRLVASSAVPRTNSLYFDSKMPRARGGTQGRGARGGAAQGKGAARGGAQGRGKKKQPGPPPEEKLPISDVILKPFNGKSFYLDITSKLTTDKLGRDIKELGGVVEGFLSKDIAVLVTNKKEAKCKRTLGVLQSMASSGSGSPPGRSGQGGEGPDRGCRQITEREDASRGRPELKKMTKEEELLQRYRILINALSWGVLVIHLDELKSFIERKKRLIQHLKTCKGDPFRASTSRPRKRKPCKLDTPYIKVNDVSDKYRPLYLQPPGFSSFQPYRPSTPPAPKRPAKRKATKRKAAKQPAAKPRLNKTWHGLPAIPEYKPQVLKPGYCECCFMRCSDVETHLESREHRAYAQGPHYEDVDNIIASFEFDFVDWSKVRQEAQRAALSVPVRPVPRYFSPPTILRPPTYHQMPGGMQARELVQRADGFSLQFTLVCQSEPIFPMPGVPRYHYSGTNGTDSPLKCISSQLNSSLQNNTLPPKLAEPVNILLSLSDSLQRSMQQRETDSQTLMDKPEFAQDDQNRSLESAGCSPVKRLKMAFTLETEQGSALPLAEETKSDKDLENSCPLGPLEASFHLPTSSTPSKLHRKVKTPEQKESNPEELPGTSSCKVSVPLEDCAAGPSRDLLEGLFQTSDGHTEFHGFSCNTVAPLEEDDDKRESSHGHVLELFSDSNSSTFNGF